MTGEHTAYKGLSCPFPSQKVDHESLPLTSDSYSLTTIAPFRALKQHTLACLVSDPNQVKALVIGALVTFRCNKVNWGVNSSTKLVRHAIPIFPVVYNPKHIKEDRVL